MINQSAQLNCSVESRQYSEGADPTVLTDIFDDQIHIAIWKRSISSSIQTAAATLIEDNPTYRPAVMVTPDNALESFNKSLSKISGPELCEDIAELVEMFCLLFNTEHAGVRLSVLDNAMCPKFHVDKIPCRLLTTYQGVATQWLPQDSVDRSKLGHGSKGKDDHESGLFENPLDIQQLNQGDVAILKGDLWDGSEGAGVVHRSPPVENNEHRLLLTMDIVS